MARNQKTGTIEIIDTDDSSFKQDVSNDFRYCVIKWLDSHDDKIEITRDDFVTYKIKMETWFHPDI